MFLELLPDAVATAVWVEGCGLAAAGTAVRLWPCFLSAAIRENVGTESFEDVGKMFAVRRLTGSADGAAETSLG